VQRRRIKNLVALVATAAISSLGAVALASAASADTPGCVTRSEFGKVYNDMKKQRVHSIFDSLGHRENIDPYGETREYQTCKGDSRSYVTVDYDTRHKVWLKWMYIGPTDSADSRCVTLKEYRRVHKNDKKPRVHSVFDTHGRFGDGGAGGYTRLYQFCKRPHRLVNIEYKTAHRPARISSKGFFHTPRR